MKSGAIFPYNYAALGAAHTHCWPIKQQIYVCCILINDKRGFCNLPRIKCSYSDCLIKIILKSSLILLSAFCSRHSTIQTWLIGHQGDCCLISPPGEEENVVGTKYLLFPCATGDIRYSWSSTTHTSLSVIVPIRNPGHCNIKWARELFIWSLSENLPHNALLVDHVHHGRANCLAIGQGGKALHPGL